MKQRVPGRAWYSGTGDRPRVLIEDDHPALAISDFTAFHDAGFEVAFCSGPGDRPRDCPLLRGQDCDLLAAADAVLHGLDPALGIADAIAERHPGIALVAEQHRHPDASLDPVPSGSTPLPYPCSVNGQLDALHQALHTKEAKGGTAPATSAGSAPSH